MRKLIWIGLVLVLAVATGCSKPAATNSDLEEKVKAAEQEVTTLKAQLKAKDDEITDLKKAAAVAPPALNEPRVAAGQGDGRFVVVPSSVRAGNPIGIFTDNGGGMVRIVRVADNKELVKMDGPQASKILLYTIPADMAAGKYQVLFSGPGGTTGEATIQVEKP